MSTSMCSCLLIVKYTCYVPCFVCLWFPWPNFSTPRRSAVRGVFQQLDIHERLKYRKDQHGGGEIFCNFQWPQEGQWFIFTSLDGVSVAEVNMAASCGWEELWMYMQCLYCGILRNHWYIESACGNVHNVKCKIFNIRISQMIFKHCIRYKSTLCQECTMHMSLPNCLS
jgi:hypothetical protein